MPKLKFFVGYINFQQTDHLHNNFSNFKSVKNGLVCLENQVLASIFLLFTMLGCVNFLWHQANFSELGDRMPLNEILKNNNNNYKAKNAKILLNM